jgi:hypothetical protein
MLRLEGTAPVRIPGISASGIELRGRLCGEPCVDCGSSTTSMGFLDSLLDGEWLREAGADESMLR